MSAWRPLVDSEIQPLIDALRAAGVDTDWCCSAAHDEHMCQRPTIQARTFPTAGLNNRALTDLNDTKQAIENVMDNFGITTYWLSLVFRYGNNDTHGGEPTWLIEIPSKHDFLALPAALGLTYIDGEDDVIEGFVPFWERQPIDIIL